MLDISNFGNSQFSICMSYRETMEQLPVTADYDQVSVRMREYAAGRYMELIEAMRPAVASILADPEGMVHELEPGRILAQVQLLKFHSSLMKDLGALYRVHDRPQEQREDVVTLAEHEAALQRAAELAELEAQEREDAAAAAAVAAVEQGRRLSLEQARLQLVAGVAALRDR